MSRPTRRRLACAAVTLGLVSLTAARCDVSARVAFAPHADRDLSGSEPRSTAVGDFDEDGDLDLAVVASALPGELTILFGDGSGGFPDENALDLSIACWGLAAADFDADGHLDLALTDGQRDGSGVLILAGDGAGDFAPVFTAPAGSFPVAAVAGDFDEDGRIDLVVANNVLYGFSFLAGNGDGSFAAPLHMPGWAGLMATGITAADLNVDGHLDVAVSHYDGVATFLGAGDGSFSYAGGVATYTNDGVAAGDLNRDGTPDLASVEIYAERLIVSFGNGDGTFSPGGSYPIGFFAQDVAIARLNGDAWPDVVVTESSANRVGVLLGAGKGSLLAEQTFATGPQPTAVAVADWNADGRLDLGVAFRNYGDTAQASVLIQTP